MVWALHKAAPVRNHQLQRRIHPTAAAGRQVPADRQANMSYDEIEIEDMAWNEELKAYTYQCPCGDLFQITLEELRTGEEIARCPSCSLYITVVYDPDMFAAVDPAGPPPQLGKEVIAAA